jgi:hypothetical protein
MVVWRIAFSRKSLTEKTGVRFRGPFSTAWAQWAMVVQCERPQSAHSYLITFSTSQTRLAFPQWLRMLTSKDKLGQPLSLSQRPAHALEELAMTSLTLQSNSPPIPIPGLASLRLATSLATTTSELLSAFLVMVHALSPKTQFHLPSGVPPGTSIATKRHFGPLWSI